VRVPFFHLLLSIAENGEFAQGVDSQYADAKGIKLGKDLIVFQAVVKSSAGSVKAKVVFLELSKYSINMNIFGIWIGIGGLDFGERSAVQGSGLHKWTESVSPNLT